MTTRPPRDLWHHLDADHQRAKPAAPPDPAVWHRYLCQRCTRHFRYQGIARCCPACVISATKAGIQGSEIIGEVSGC